MICCMGSVRSISIQRGVIPAYQRALGARGRVVEPPDDTITDTPSSPHHVPQTFKPLPTIHQLSGRDRLQLDPHPIISFCIFGWSRPRSRQRKPQSHGQSESLGPNHSILQPGTLSLRRRLRLRPIPAFRRGAIMATSLLANATAFRIGVSI